MKDNSKLSLNSTSFCNDNYLLLLLRRLWLLLLLFNLLLMKLINIIKNQKINKYVVQVCF